MSKTSSPKKASRSTSKGGPAKAAGTSKLDTLLTLLRQPAGVTIAELAKATGWQTHSVRGAIAGALKKKGHVVASDIVGGVRRYRVAEGQA